MFSFWPFKRASQSPEATVIEKRSSMSGFTAELMAARESYISGRRGIAELTGTAQSCISLWESGLAIAEVKGTRFLNRSLMAIIARSLALRGEFVGLVRGDGVVPASDWDLRTRDGRPTAYRLSVSEAGGGSTMTALAPEVLHVRIGSDPAAPWLGTAPLRRASLTASMLNAIESALAEVYENAPLGSQVVPMPEMPDTDMTSLGRDFRGRRGRVVLRESVNVSAGGGPTPNQDWRPQDLTPGLERAVPIEALNAARDSIAMAFGCLPAMFNQATTGPVVREGQRHLSQWTLQPIGELLAEEASEKLGATVEVDVIGPTQSFDQGASARAFKTMLDGLVAAKEAGLSDAAVASVLGKLDWKD